MLTLNTASDAVITQIRRDAGVWEPEQLRDLLEAGRRQRAPDFDSVVRGLAVRYSGDQAGIVRSALRRAYPRTGEKMPVDPVNWLRFFARQDSGVYTSPAVRALVDDEGEPLDEEDPRAVAFAQALDQMGADVLMPEAERRMHTGARSVFVLLGYRRVTSADVGKVVAHLYWPHDVISINHPSAPDDPEAVWFVAIRQAREQTSVASDVWWVWSRGFTEDAMGTLVSFTPWSHRRLSEDGQTSTPSEVYPGRFPGALLRAESPTGGLWPEPDRDVAGNVDHLNVARSNRQHVVDMQAHAQGVYVGITRETNELVVGPDAMIQIGSGESLSYLVPGADHDAIEASATRDLQELGVSRGNSPDAYAVEPGAAQSGVSRLIANAPHDQRVAESRPVFKRFEEQVMLPIVVDLLERFSPTAPASFNGATPVVTLGASKGYEDDAAKTQRVLDLKAAGIIDDADARVMLGLSADRAEALAYLEESKPAAPVARGLPGALVGSPFTSPRETTPVAPAEDDDA
jgi:hypothetical protein